MEAAEPPLLVLNAERTGASPFGCLQTYRTGVKEEVDGGVWGLMLKTQSPFSLPEALILGVSGGARGHVSLISSAVRVRWLAAFFPFFLLSSCGAQVERGCCV